VPSQAQRLRGADEGLRRLTIRLSRDDYSRLSALAAAEGVAVAVKCRELTLAAMDPQIFGERYHDVERLLRGVVREEISTHAERLHKRLYRVGGITASGVFFIRRVLELVLNLDPTGSMNLWREAEGLGFKYMGTKAPGVEGEVAE
jgi:hypothetical protein